MLHGSHSSYYKFQLQVDGVNLLKINLNAKDAIAYGRALLDRLFSKQEQRTSLLFATAKSNKPALNQEKVELLLSKLQFS